MPSPGIRYRILIAVVTSAWRPSGSRQGDCLEEPLKGIGMLAVIGRMLLGCTHKRTTFPQRSRRQPASATMHAAGDTYVACLGCGKEFQYDWSTMRIGDPLPGRDVASDVFRLGSARTPAQRQSSDLFVH